MKFKITAFCFVSFLVYGCTTENKTFHAPEIGWTINLIDGWDIESARKVDQDIHEGLALIENSGESVYVSGKEIGLFVLRSDEITKFQATIIPFEETYENEWNDKYPQIKDVIYPIVAYQGVQVDSTSSKETIDNIAFEVFNIKLSQNGSTLMEQNMYRTYIKGYDFIINMSHNSINDKKAMLATLRASKFDKK
ncbi:hypothetical protein [Cellulophaga sp. E6(2014)]|uniref:hypothetical protein n=1 Tax=Cellulophaga sp. E6(2014) TaxID=1495334 RepID=UPI00051DACB4|nr:hypothetical protein [Cellulophaga sp. E6(2014)]KGK30671.1 hypothetical protein EL45_08490 [Cellulophaga sp. E6(2014)]